MQRNAKTKQKRNKQTDGWAEFCTSETTKLKQKLLALGTEQMLLALGSELVRVLALGSEALGADLFSRDAGSRLDGSRRGPSLIPALASPTEENYKYKISINENGNDK